MHAPRLNAGLVATLFAGLLTGLAQGAVMMVEEFQADPNWQSRDGEMTVAWSSGVGNMAGSLQGTFADQAIPFPEIDAFRIDFNASGGPWIGDFHTLYPSNTQLTFDFMANDVLPSSLVIQISDGFTTFIRNLFPQLGGVGSFINLSAPLAYDGNWLGGNALQFSNVLGSVNFIDIQLARNSTASQSYFVDNFAINNDTLPGPPPATAVPEASTLQFAVIAFALLIILRRKLHPHQRANMAALHERMRP